MIKEHIVYLALGANLGDRRRNIRQAIERIAELIGPVERQSSLYETQPWGFSSPHAFINACICCRTTMSPLQVLRATQKIEKEMTIFFKKIAGRIILTNLRVKIYR